MLFLIVSTPRPERPSEMAARRTSFWPWLATLEASAECKWSAARVGRGAAVLLDVASNERLHAVLNQWAEIIPATFEVYPLVDVASAKALLAGQMKGAG